ncbi:MAG TPA: glycosyltransferase family 39 protein [Burkholderiales bacterium]
MQKKTFLLALLFTVLARLLTLGAYPLFDTTEARYAEIARKMVETGNWVTPQISYGVPFWGKPPLSTWLAAGSINFFGVNEIAARLPSFMLAFLIGWLIYYLALKQRGCNYALMGVLVLATTALFFIMAGQVMPDQALALGTTLSMVAFWRALAETGPTGRTWGYLFFAGLGVGILAKGLVAIVLILLPIGTWIFLYKKWRTPFNRLPWILGTLLMLAIALPWYLLAEMRTPGFLEYFIVGEHWGRFTQSGWHGDLYGSAHVHPYGMIWLYWVAAAFPWSLIFIVLLVKRILPFEQPYIAIVKDEWLTYLLLWAVMPLIFFTFTANILLTYVLPSLPAFALLMTEALQRTTRRGTTANTALDSVRLTIICIATPLIAILILIFVVPNAAPYKSQKDLVARYKILRSDSSSRLIYLVHRPYSAEFYSQGKAENIADLNKAAMFISEAKESFFAAREEDLKRMPPTVLMQLEPIGRFGHYELLRKHSR